MVSEEDGPVEFEVSIGECSTILFRHFCYFIL